MSDDPVKALEQRYHSPMPGAISMNEQPNGSIFLSGLPILSAIVGSQAYGLAGPDSDYDYLGVYVVDTHRILGLWPHKDTVRRVDPDMTFHEVGKFVRLALCCNPTILELLWAEEYGTCDEHGKKLVEMRSSFLSKRVLKTYAEYARSQVHAMERNPDHWRYAKHARHTMRLLQQGYELVTTGNLTLKVPNPDELHAMAKLPIGEFKQLAEEKAAAILTADCVLPDEPDLFAVSDLLVSIRQSCTGFRRVPGAPFNMHQAVVPEVAIVKAWGGQE